MKDKIKKMLSLGVFALTISSGSYACNQDDNSSPEANDARYDETVLTMQAGENNADEDQLLDDLLLSPQSSFGQSFQDNESDDDPYEELQRSIDRFMRSVDEFIPYYPGNGTRVSVMANYLPYYIYGTVYDDILSFSIPSLTLNSTLRTIQKSQGMLPDLTEYEMVSPKALALYIFRNWQTIFEFLGDTTGEEIDNINFDVSMMNDDEPILPGEEGEECWKSVRWINNTDHILNPCLMNYLPRYISELIYTEFFGVTLEYARVLNAARYSFTELSQALCGILDDCIVTSRLNQDDLLPLFERSGVIDVSHDDADYIINDNIIPLPDLSAIEATDLEEFAKYFVRNWATLYLMLCIKRPQIRGSIPLDFE